MFTEPNFLKVFNSAEKPTLYAPGDACFWTEPHIAGQLLSIHLDSKNEAASRNIETIQNTVLFWVNSGLVKAGDRLLDLGCGPGLYALPLARAGVKVCGIDQSANSLAYAREEAKKQGLDVEYREMNFLDLQEEDGYEAAVQVYGEFCTLSDSDRVIFLDNVNRALKPGGLFLLDITTRRARLKYGLKNRWMVGENGFWRKAKHVILEMGFDYPEQDAWLDQYTVIDADGKTTVYRNWFHDYSLATFSPVVEKAGFVIETIWGDLMGSPYSADGEWFAVALRKK